MKTQDKAFLQAVKNKKLVLLDRAVGGPKHARYWFKCIPCGAEKVRWYNSIMDSSATPCTACSHLRIRGSAKEHKAWLKENKPTLRLIGKYVNFGTPALHLCTVCKTESPITPEVLAKSTGAGCRICSRRAVQAFRNEKCRSEYITFLKSKGCTMLPTTPYEKALTAIPHKCTKCGYERTVTPDYMKRLAKCTSCSPKNLSRTVETRHKSFVLFGYEERCLELLRQHYRYSEIETFNSGKVPLIYYGKGQRYMPDFYVKKDNMVVEAKGLATFGMRKFPISKDSDSTRYYQCCAKAKATLAAGYRYAFCLIENNERMYLPPDWYEYSYKEMKNYIKGLTQR